MPTTYSDQFWVIDPYAPPPVGTTLTVEFYDIVDQNDNDLINRFSNDSIDGVDITASYPGDTVTVTLDDGSTVTVTGTTFYLADGRQVFTPTDGTVLEDATLVSTSYVTSQGPLDVGDLGPPCFVAGSLIGTPDGEIEVQDICADEWITEFSGASIAVRKVLCRAFSARDLADNPKLRPVRILAGALGNGLPRRDLLVSRQHRMLVSSKIAERMFGVCDVLVPAIKLTELPGIYVDKDVDEVRYYHLLFDRHEVIFAEGAPTESLFTGPEAIKSLTPEAREEILTIFPEVLDPEYVPVPAAPIPSLKMQKQLMARHIKNQKPPLELFEVHF